MNKLEKFPLWVRVYARKKRKSILEQLFGVLVGLIAILVLDYLLNGQEVSVIYNEDNIFKYFTVLFVLVFHVLMVNSANNWVSKNSSLKDQYQFLPKWISYLIGFVIIILFVLIKIYLLEITHD